MSEPYAAHSVDLTAAQGDGLPRRVHLLPIGRVTGKNGAGPYTVRDPAHARQIVAATQAWHQGAPFPIDYDHQTLRAATNGQPAPAAAWVTALEVDDHGVWGTVEWTPAAADQVRAKAYRFVSPVFHHAADGTVTRIWHASVTNLPNLGELTAFAHQLPPTSGAPMTLDEYLSQLRATFGLPADADAGKIAAHAQSMVTGAKATTTALASAAKALGLADTASGDQVAAAAQDMAGKAKAGGAVDTSKYVPMEQYTALSQTVTEMQKKMVRDEAAAEVAAAVSAGKIAPATQDHMLAWASQDLAGFKAFVAAAPVIVSPGGTGVALGQPPAGEGGLTAEDVAVCSQLGLSPDDYKKHKGGK